LVAAVELPQIPDELAVAEETFTDSEGRFVLCRARANADYFVFTPMAPLAAANLSAVGREVRTGNPGSAVELGEISMHPAHRVHGVLSFKGAPSKRPQVRAVLGRWTMPDAQEVIVSETGEFTFQGVPSEPIALTFHENGRTMIEGYRLATQNVSLDYLSLQELHGRVDDDLDLTVLLEPGTVPAQRGSMGRVNPVNPRIRVGPSGVRRVNRKELEPLRGAPAE
jgi:hypothetical protein